MGHGLLTGKTAIITGAGQGLGRGIALAYADEGAALALFERNTDTLAAVMDELRGRGATVHPYALDLLDTPALLRAVEAAAGALGRIDILVNNAGVFRSGTIFEDTDDDWRFVMGVNVEALYRLTKAVVPHMAAQREGRIINISSIAADHSRGSVGSYNASKGAVSAFTKSLAVELAPYNILSNAIAPGFLKTAQMQDAAGNDLTEGGEFTDWYVTRRKIPLARAGEPADVAGTAVFLASEYCRYLTGQVIVVDGGLTSTF
jgi:3-oxoacyl-[acyl-carrier protein] reductase